MQHLEMQAQQILQQLLPLLPFIQFQSADQQSHQLKENKLADFTDGCITAEEHP